MSRGAEHFSKKSHDYQQVHEKMLNISDYQGKAKENHTEPSPHTRPTAVTEETTQDKRWQPHGVKVDETPLVGM